MDLLVANGKLVMEKGAVKADLAIDGGKISAIGRLEPPAGTRVLDAKGKLVLPGVIDAHTHFGLVVRGAVTADGWEEGTLSAACGGVTTCIDYADPFPGKPLVEGAREKLVEAEGKAYIDYTVHMVVHRWINGRKQELQELKEIGIASLKVFTTYDQKIADRELELLLEDAGDQGLLVTVHAEDDDLVRKLRSQLEQRGDTEPQNHGISRPPEVEERAVAKVIEAAQKLDVPVYFVHVSTGGGASRIAEARRYGQKVYGETCPQYLILDDGVYASGDPRPAIMTPPLRLPGHQEGLWQALSKGALQVVATDHCAYTLEQKRRGKTCFDTLPGIPGSETLLPLLYTFGVGGGHFDVTCLARLLSTNPAKLFGLYPQKGCIEVGSDADLVIFDPEKEVVLDGEKLHSSAGYTPFAGIKVRGYPETTLLRGEVIFHRGEFMGRPGIGRFVKAVSTSSAYNNYP